MRSAATNRLLLNPATRSLSFNGSSDVAVSNIIPDPSGFSFGLWLKSLADGDYKRILSYTEGSGTNGCVLYKYSNRIAFQMYNSSVVPVNVEFGTLPKGNWIHVSITFVPNNFKAFINGVQVYSIAAGAMSAYANHFLTLARQAGAADYWKGQVADLYFQNTVTPWTVTQIADLMYRRITPSGAKFYSFDGHVLDQNGANGLTLTGGTYVGDRPC